MAEITVVHDAEILRVPSNLRAGGVYMRDTYFDEEHPNNAYGELSYEISVGVKSAGGKGDPGDELHGLWWYDLNKFLPRDATVNAAVWHFYLSNTSAQNDQIFRLQRISRDGWVEAEATWNIWKTGSNWTTPGGDFTGTVVDLTAMTTTGWKARDIKTAIVSPVWPPTGGKTGICTFGMYRDDPNMDDVGLVVLKAKESWDYGLPSWETVIPHLRITYTLAGKTFEAIIH